MMHPPIPNRLYNYLLKILNNYRVKQLAADVQKQISGQPPQKPIVFFNASTRLGGISQNAAYSILASMGLQLSGYPIVHFACRGGMSRCPLGTNPDDHTQPPPCQICISQSEVLFSNAHAHWFTYEIDPDLNAALENLSLSELTSFAFQDIPLGRLTLPTLRWVLRRHHLLDDAATRRLQTEFIRSSYHIAKSFTNFLDEFNPVALVVFNGIMFPEGTARWVAKQRGIHVITHEVAHQPLTAFFSHKEVTAYPVNIPNSFDLSPEQNAKLDKYLENRFQGDFSMAGIQFWPQMQELDEDFLKLSKKFRQVVTIFTNVIFDTSQVHANTVFEHMFAWLDHNLELIRNHTETLFVIRAHPDELRPDSRKKSRETVRQWVTSNLVHKLPNVVYVDAREYISSYALIQKSKFVMVYNSTIGLEAALMGKPVLCGGKARYTQYPCVFFPNTPESFRTQAEQFLNAEEIEVPDEFIRNARRFQYYQLFRTPLPFGSFIEPHPTRGYIKIRNFSSQSLNPSQSQTMRVIVDGILDRKEFLMPDDSNQDRHSQMFA